MVALRFLLDTNILSEPTKLKPNTTVVRRLTAEGKFVATASVVYHELKMGGLIMPESRKKQETMSYLAQNVEGVLPILPYGEAAAKWHAEERTRLRRTGNTPPYIDGQIAAIAFTNNLTLVTRNITDFQNFQGLKLENWFE